MKLIGLNGLKRSGKDTAYQILSRELTTPGPAGRVERRAFADKLKIMAALALGFDRTEDVLISLMDEAKDEWILSVLKAELPRNEWESYPEIHRLTGREYLQNFGNHARRVFGDSFWVDQVLPLNTAFESVWSTVGRNTPGARFVGRLPKVGVVTDVRYPNEAERVRAHGGQVWEIIRPGQESDGHITEQRLPLELIDITIDNGGTLDDYAKSLLTAYRTWDEVEIVDGEVVE